MRSSPARAINKSRQEYPPDKLKRHLTMMMCNVTGGPQKYEGRSMKEAHAHLNITAKEWDVMIADFKTTLDKFEVPVKEQGELLAIVESTKKDIVTK